MKKISKNILSWCNNPEQGAIEQAINLSKHPKLVGNVCLMPDTHQGYGMPIGGVVALEGAVSPNMVGVDMGCGMLAVKTNLKDISVDDLKRTMDLIRNKIPLGMNHHKENQENDIFDSDIWEKTIICKEEKEAARKQLGTLGGGNHFIEIQKGNDGHIWFMIHSGSRNLGFKVANYYNKLAEEINLKYGLKEVVENELCFFPQGTYEYDMYMNEMCLCLEFALQNRYAMSDNIITSFNEVIGICIEDVINIHHNYASLEKHYGKNVIVHRKGATLARENTIGIIPGSQGTCSYIVKGKGNAASLNSCSHGAGRRMSRKKAQENLDLNDEINKLDKKGILHSIKTSKDLDEASGAYKDIDIVMEEQKDLVEILVKLEPLGVIKG